MTTRRSPPRPNHVRELREAAGLSQQALANMAGLSRRTIVYAEQGAPCRPPTKRAILLALGKDYLAHHPEVFPNG